MGTMQVFDPFKPADAKIANEDAHGDFPGVHRCEMEETLCKRKIQRQCQKGDTAEDDPPLGWIGSP